MNILKTNDFSEMSDIASKILIKEITNKKKITIGLATGKTQIGLYKNLVDAYKAGDVNFSRVKTFNLDEFYPIEKEDKNSYWNYMHKKLFNHINIKKENISLLNGITKNPKKECIDYEKKIKKTPIDIQMLGLGINGHIGFNEPGSSFNSKTRLVDLSPETIKEKKGPNMALTMGIKTIMSAKKIILLASGNKKAKAIYNLVKCDIRKEFPASFLRKHKNFTVIIDKNAGKLLRG